MLDKILAFVKFHARARSGRLRSEVPPFPLEPHIKLAHGFPVVDWKAVSKRIEALPRARRAKAWAACEHAWLLKFRDTLGPRFRLYESRSAALLSCLEPSLAEATVDFMGRTRRRIRMVLEGIAQVPPWGKDTLIVFDDDESYYRYVSHYYPNTGEFARSGGMCINEGCVHYVTASHDLRDIERTITHEMTHACLAHLPIPAWLNEGIAVNVENRLAQSRVMARYTPQQLHARLQRFWSAKTIQEFWAGSSFLRPDEGNALSYELARIVVEQLAKEWRVFKCFVLAAQHNDGGAAAARENLGVDLGEVVAALLEKNGNDAKSWSPRPQIWREANERV
jgi:hypothetical protein